MDGTDCEARFSPAGRLRSALTKRSGAWLADRMMVVGG